MAGDIDEGGSFVLEREMVDRQPLMGPDGRKTQRIDDLMQGGRKMEEMFIQTVLYSCGFLTNLITPQLDLFFLNWSWLLFYHQFLQAAHVSCTMFPMCFPRSDLILRPFSLCPKGLLADNTSTGDGTRKRFQLGSLPELSLASNKSKGGGVSSCYLMRTGSAT